MFTRFPLPVIPVLLASGLGLTACNGESTTYYGDIAPILEKNCVSCHHTGGVGPFALDNYDMVLALREPIIAAIESRSMPPQNLDNSGDCQTFKDARWMADEEIAMVRAWVDAEAPEGNAKNAAPLPELVELTLPGEQVDAQMTEPYMARANLEQANDDYRCFFVGESFDTDKFLTGFTVSPQNPAIFHHMLLFNITSDESEMQASALEAEDPEAGWSCFGDGGVDDSTLLAVWAPGRRSVVYPEGTGVKIEANHRMVMQVHYNLLAGAVPDQSSLVLSVEDSVEKEAILTPMLADDFELPPNQEEVFATAKFPLFGLGVPEIEVHGIFPHMHLLGRTLEYEYFRTFGPEDQESTCLARVNNWDFEWQDTLFYEKPLILTAEHSVQITCSFNTMGRTEPVTWGDGTQDEMCLVFSYVSLPQGGELDL